MKTAFLGPKSLLKKNRDELLAFTDFEPEDICIYDGAPKKRKQLREGDFKIFLCGFDMFGREWPKLVAQHPDLKAVVADEWHMGYATWTSHRTQSLYNFIEQQEAYFLAMTGTIIKGRLSSAFPLLQIIEPSYYPTIHVFDAYHAIKDEYDRVVAWRQHDVLGGYLRRHSIRRTFEEVYGPEAKVIVTEQVPMGKKQRELYDEFEEFALLELEDSFLASDQPGVHVIRCRQIMAHPESIPDPKDDKGKARVDLMRGEVTGKDQRLEIHLEDHLNTGEPLLIFAALKPEQLRILELVESKGMTCALINSDVSTSKRFKIDEDFQSGKVQVVVGSAATMGVGFNWSHLNHIIFASIDYEDSNFVQAYRRGIRGKREDPLLITVLEYENSVDQKLFQIVSRKSQDAHLVDPTVHKISLGDHRKDVAHVAA